MTPTNLIKQLAYASDVRQMGKIIVSVVLAQTPAIEAYLVWGLSGEWAPEVEPSTCLPRQSLDLVQAALTRSHDSAELPLPSNPAVGHVPATLPVTVCEGDWLALPLGNLADAALLARLPPGFSDVSGETFQGEMLLALGEYLDRIIEVSSLRQAVSHTERAEKLQRALFAISDVAGSDGEMIDVLTAIHKIVGTLMYAENFFIVLYDSEDDTVQFLYYADEEDDAPPDPSEKIPMSQKMHSLTWYLIRDGRSLMGSPEVLLQQVSGPIALHGPDSDDWMGVPMVRDGQVRGALVVQSYHQGQQFTAEDHSLLEFVGSHIITALDRKQSKDELERRVLSRTAELAASNEVLQVEIVERQRGERLQAALFGIAQLAGASLTQEEFYQRIHHVVGDLMNARNFFIALLSDDRAHLEFPYYVDAHQNTQEPRPLGNSLSEYVLRTREPLMGSTQDVIEMVKAGLLELSEPAHSAVCWLGVPLFVGEDVIGLVAVQSYDQQVTYSEADQELLVFVASQIANSLTRRRAAEAHEIAFEALERRVDERTAELRNEIVERERIQDQLKHQVMHDPLTGLPNRSYMREQITRVIAQVGREPGRCCALLYLDIDRFKLINDTLGHLAGDEVLREVSARLLSCVRSPDMVGRLSGDEFAVLLENVENQGNVVRVASRIIKAMSQPMMVSGRQIEPSASVGIAMGGKHYHLADDMLRDADTALYRAKAQGRNRFELFDEQMQKTAIDVLTLEGELKIALQKDQFEPYFQPIIRLKTNEVVGYEALIRWNHPERGVIGPPDFLSVAENSGSMEAIDWRMFEMSCDRMAQLANSRPFLTINVSPQHLRRPGFDSRLLELLDRTDFSPAHLMTEITEGCLLDNTDHVRDTLDRLRTMGVGAALDDFGTGYSSLGYLHNFSLRMLKIDRSFVTDLTRSGKGSSIPVVTAVLALATALDMEVVAEGIETEEQRLALVELGCDMGQGFLLGRPAPIEHWVAKEAAQSK
jgi:diguanylate cyclase (GGDEF)-like protein